MGRWTLGLLARASLLPLAMLPAAALAQTEPFLPLPALPIGPQTAVPTGQPLNQGQTVTDRARPELSAQG
ncbi:MAG TPA: hypothetical protein VKT70_10385, partial [Stellaceae bacterium]|nr:hypothetical protein [Stellaceae bacterium]